MIVYTVDEDLRGKEVVVEHDVRRMNGTPGERKFECYCKVDSGPYYLRDGKDRIFLTSEDAKAAIDNCRQAG